MLVYLYMISEFHSYTRMLYCMSCNASYTLHYCSDLHPFFYLFIVLITGAIAVRAVLLLVQLQER